MKFSRLCVVVVLLCATLLPLAASAQDTAPEDSECCWFQTEGYVFADLNNDGIMNGGDYGLVGWTVVATDTNDVFSTSVVTGAGGYYLFPNGPGFCGVPFRLRQVDQSGWNRTSPVNPGYHQQTHGACDGTIFGPYNFGNFDCGNVQKIYTVDSEFNQGVLNGVITNSDQLELDPSPTTFGFGWIANADDGTISKIDLATGDEVGRYYTGPPDINGNYPYLNPSRTVVDEDGNCWVANRTEIGHPPSVTMILADGGVDFNSNTTIETSSDCCPVDGQIGGVELLPWGQDERVVRHYQVGTTLNNWARGMAIDKMGFLWVGLSSDQRLVKLKTNHPVSVFGSNQPQTLVPEEFSLPLCTAPNVCFEPYGLALSPSGFIYVSTLSEYALEVDPGLASGGTSAGPAVTSNWIKHPGAGNYGIAVDKDCVVWLAKFFTGSFGCVRWDPAVGLNNPALGWASSNPGAQGMGRGITVDFNGDIWMATNQVDGVTKFDNANPPNVLGNYPSVTSSMPTGIGTASDGNMILVGQLASDWEKRNVSTGAYMPLPGPQLAGYHPYTYSDFTGSLQQLVNKQQGMWTVTTDGGFPGLLWNYIDWTDLVPPQTSVTVEARSAYTLSSLAIKPWTLVTTPGFQTPPYPGQYIETRVRLQRDNTCGQPFITPVLYDLTVAAVCDSCFIACPPDTVVECEGLNGSTVVYSDPVIGNLCDSTYVVTCVPPSGSLFPLGINTVTCTAISATPDTITCAFTVTVTGDCLPTPMGACCLDQTCTITTEAHCEQVGGIYYGDGSDCTQGCTYSCLPPPAGLSAWWPMNGPATGTTPNLGDPGANGTLHGPPTLQNGVYVGNSYSFPGNALTYIEVPSATSVNPGTGDFSIDVWVKNSAAGRQPIVDKRQTSGQPIQGYYFFLQDGYPGLQMAHFGSAADFVLDSFNSGAAGWVGDGQWHLIAVTVDRNDPNGVRFYVDGIPVGPTFDPTSLNGTLNTTVDLFIGQSYPFSQSAQFYDGSMDELEIFKRELTATDVDNLYAVGASGKCMEACYASELTNCCDGQGANAWFTICNYDVVAHTYSWGATPQPAGSGCFGAGASSFKPPSGTVSVPAGGCVTVPIEIACPTGIQAGKLSCYQISVFNHDTGNIFGCRGSVRRPGWWCPKVTRPSGSDVVDVIDVVPFPGLGTVVKVKLNHIGFEPVPGFVEVEVHPLDPQTGDPSPSLSLDGLPPGEPVTRDIPIPPGETAVEFELTLSYPESREIGMDAFQIRLDDDMDGVAEPVGEGVTRGSAVTAVDVPTFDEDIGGETLRPFLALPNPFNRSGRISFRLTGNGPQRTTLGLYDVTGKRVAIFHKKAMLAPGVHEVEWDGTDGRHERLPSGVYFLRLQAPDVDETVKVVLIR